ncbi:hypothetical protein STRIP9103_03184 [Streptomyces ipomoeae 91-03]|uniref:Uncharacterized protein n=1 Tax=Streptomyces ipomoeae 91-03 TaxID=698759 RepID=L1L5S2_9ACTN|nr:hypothetical protein STRIP9103_03184 [Streptomyces ipomoeae 91-03]
MRTQSPRRQTQQPYGTGPYACRAGAGGGAGAEEGFTA